MEKSNWFNKEPAAAIRRITLILALCAGIGIGVWQSVPSRVNENSPDYPAYRQMMDNIQDLAAKPHPTGSEENERVRAAIITEIEEMGLTPIIDDASYTPDEYLEVIEQVYRGLVGENYDSAVYAIEQYRLDQMINILVKLETAGAEGSILFVSHFDTSEEAPGAADDTLPVCIMLEVLRAHWQNNSLKNNLYFLFTDGEEDGLLGAWKFVRNHPELKNEIDIVINLEMRGNRGAPLLFETSPQPYQELRTIIRSGAKPITASWMTAVYEILPNYTDLQIFLEAGYQGVNFAAVGGGEHYHEPTDNFENLDRNTAWHYLQTVLAIADYAASNSLDNLGKTPQDAVFFPFFPGNTVLMTSLVSNILCAGICLLSVFLIALDIKRKQFKISFSFILMIILILLSIASSIWFIAVSYLMYLPLLAMCLVKLTKPKTIANLAVRALSWIGVLMVWTPVFYLIGQLFLGDLRGL